MENFNENHQIFISKLERVQEIFKEIREKDKKRLVIQYKDRDTLEKLARSNEKMISKLKKQEFTVAVVGLEKAGKSTLANALLNLIVLPEYTERCTYTITEIRAGSSDTAEVYFYSKDKFEKNFQQMLKEIEYPQEISFEDLTLEDFKDYWNKVDNNSSLFQQHNGTTVSDIKAMLSEKDAIIYLTDKEPDILNVTDNDDYDKLYRYITGIEDYKDGHVERTAEPYAVEKVIIKSTGLADMKNIVLYDVPGFDSPTDLHKKQTEDMLKISDAIILVTNVGDRPNLTGTQLDMLQKGRDEDDISLSDKVFVFGNKLDMAGTPQMAKDNQAALIHDAVDQYKIVRRERIICGSAKAYLESQGKESRDDKARGSRNINVALEKLGVTDGMEELKSKLKHYYDNDRFEVLKKRSEKTIATAKQFLNVVLSKYDAEDAEEIDDGGQYLLQAKDLLDDFVKKAGEISREYIKQIQDERPFSALIYDSIDEIFPNENVNSIRVIDVENTGKIGEGYALSRSDALTREQLSFTFQKNIVTKTSMITLAKEEEIYQKLAKALLQSLKMDENSSYCQELENSAKRLFKSLLIENGEHCYFNPLIERYITGLLETLIKSPYASAERLQKLISLDIMSDILSLSSYYQNEKSENILKSADDKQKYFFARILTHNEVTSADVVENENTLRKFFNEYNTNLAAGFDFDKLPFSTWSSILANIGIKVSESDLLERLKKALINFVGVKAWSQMSPKDKNRQLNNAIIDYCAGAKPITLVD